MRVALAQINAVIGGFALNREKIITYACRAAAEDAEMVLFPEMALCGYPPMDLVDQDSFVENNLQTLHQLQRSLPAHLAVGVGFVARSRYRSGKSLVNEYGILYDGAVVFRQIKTLLPTYDVFDEARNFEPAQEWLPFAYKGERIGFAICEDVWRETDIPGTAYKTDPVQNLLDQGITMLCVPSASPFVAGKLTVRHNLAVRLSRRGHIPFLYLNAVGANDSIIFDGRSFVKTPDKENIVLQAAAFREDLIIFDTVTGAVRGASACAIDSVSAGSENILCAGELDTIEEALILGIRDYLNKCGFTRAHLGLSGGIDSALVAYLAVKALGAEKVSCFSMPSRFSSQGSKDDAASLVQNLGCRYETLSIEPVFSAFLSTLEQVFTGLPFDSTEENVQARIRGVLVMAYANKFNSMLLTTGNKSELAMGYCTLYGDMCGALAPIGDLLKTEVFALCRRINEKTPVIPQAIIDKAPSAELRPNQTDQDSLPPYEILDEILRYYLLDNLSAAEIIARGFDQAIVKQVVRSVAGSEFKRRQAPPVLKISKRAFGMGRRMPIARITYEY
ncbi:MAG: NAD+ synthase [Spirochaetaceae bacterium]|jgi:NAD+ synthase (glutamine-hydrolysing)|nr:NAD+ synthase [Spirochaetaceae bacterium]